MPDRKLTKPKLPRQRQHLPIIRHPIKSIRKIPSLISPKVLSTDDKIQISALKARLCSTEKAVFVTGAGISVNAGSKRLSPPVVDPACSSSFEDPDFRTMRNSARQSFDISVYNTREDTERFHTTIRDIWTRSTQAEPTKFHIFMDQFAQRGCLLRLYTQNIDCVEQQLPSLEETTLRVHGRIDEVLCQYCGWKGLLVPSAFVGPEPPLCTNCHQVSLEREKSGKRRLAIGRLRPSIVLYGEENPDCYTISETAAYDVRQGPDVVYVAGTALKIPGARKMTRDLCRAAKAQGGLVVWISQDPPPSGLGFSFDFILKGDCDQFAALLSHKDLL